VLRWFGPKEVDLPDGLGRARLWIPFFDLGDGGSLSFIDLDSSKIAIMPDEREVIRPDGLTRHSWKGFGVNSSSSPEDFGVTEIDLRKGADISVDRDHLQLAADTVVYKFVRGQKRQLLEEFFRSQSGSQFDLLNHCNLPGDFNQRGSIPSPNGKFWKQTSGSEQRWQQVHLPAAEIQSATYVQHVDRFAIEWQKKPVANLPRMKSARHVSSLSVSNSLGGGRFAIFKDPFGDYAPAVLWSAEDDIRTPGDTRHYWATDLPPEWANFLAIVSPYRSLWNRSHPLVHAIAKRTQSSVPLGKDAKAGLARATMNRETAILTAISVISRGAREWNALRDNFPNEIAKLCDVIGLSENSPLHIWRYMGGYKENSVISLKPSGAEQVVSTDTKEGLKLPSGDVIPWPSDDEWYLRVNATDEELLKARKEIYGY
jgi:hypothetical protein